MMLGKPNQPNPIEKTHKQIHEIHQQLLKEYINEGTLTTDLINEKKPIFDIILYVSYNENKKLRLWICGECPHCNSCHIRNTCNCKFINDVIFPIINKKFTYVNNITPILSSDKDFYDIVNHFSGIVTHLDFRDKNKFYHLKRFMKDGHPFVDSFNTFLKLKNDKDSHYNNESLVSMKDICNKYNICWKIEDNTCFVEQKTALIYTGIEEILNNQDKLPLELKVVGLQDYPLIPDELTYVIMCGDYNFFKNEIYKFIRFNNPFYIGI